MPEPTSTSGISVTVLAVSLLGPLAGPYALIVFASLAGALWPLSAHPTETRTEGAWLLLRCATLAIILTVFLSSLIERYMGFPALEALAPVALLIGAMGNGWKWVFETVFGGLKSRLEQAAGGQK